MVHKEGIICNSYETNHPRNAIVAQEPGCGLDLYIDLRKTIGEIHPMTPDLAERPLLSHLTTRASEFAVANPDGRFAFVRL